MAHCVCIRSDQESHLASRWRQVRNFKGPILFSADTNGGYAARTAFEGHRFRSEKEVTVSLEEILNEMPEDRRRRIEQRAAELIAEELNLRELRRLRKLTQARLSRKLKIGQEGVSRIEKRTDLYISTLRSYVEGVGGKLSLVVELPDRPPVILAGLGIEDGAKKTKKRAKSNAKSKAKSRRAAQSAGDLFVTAF